MGQICIVSKAFLTNIGDISNLKVSAIYRGLCLRNYVIGETGINGLVPGSTALATTEPRSSSPFL